MLLYHATHDRWELTRPMLARMPKREGYPILFTSAPVAGMGPFVFTMELPDHVAAKYEFEWALQVIGVSYYNIPCDIVNRAERAAPMQLTPYLALTGRPWTEWEVVLKHAVPDKANTWCQLWSSRRDAVDAEIMGGGMADVVAKINLTPAFDPSSDYLILETQQFNGKQWTLELLAGMAPAWADFPTRWNDWVWDETVQASAAQHLIGLHPPIQADIEYASGQEEKVNKMRAWRIVADKLGIALGMDVGRIAAGSWTSTMAMPLRIAQRVGNWSPPIPKPEYESPDESGRILLATPPREAPTGPTNPISGRIDRRFDPEPMEEPYRPSSVRRIPAAANAR